MRSRILPGGGFVILVASWSALAVFLAWGLAEPDLDRVWRILAHADMGRAAMSAEDAEVLARTIARHPEIALERLGRHRIKHLARTPAGWSSAADSFFLALPAGRSGLPVRVETRGARNYPVRVRVSVGGIGCVIVFSTAGAGGCVVPLATPADPPRPVLGRLVLDGVFPDGDTDSPTGIRFVESAAAERP